MKGKSAFGSGVRAGLPICFGYLSVSFAFGIFATKAGLTVWETLLVSMTNVTSAGQLAGVPFLVGGGSLMGLAFTQFIINLRYALMSVTLSQKFDSSIRLIDRFLLAFVDTDEVFGVASSQDHKVPRGYMYGLILTPYVGWSLGTLIGALAGEVFPASVTSALGVAIYGMFVAICVPEAQKNRKIALCILLAIGLSCLIRYVPVLNAVLSDYSVILCAVTASLVFALIDTLGKDGDAK